MIPSGFTLTPDRLAEQLRADYPELLVTIGKNDSYVAMQPPRTSHPQVDIRFDGRQIEWQGYYVELRWGSPIGNILGLPGLKYVYPVKNGRASKQVALDRADPNLERRIFRMTRRWFQIHPPGQIKEPPAVPAGYRLATLAEIAASRD